MDNKQGIEQLKKRLDEIGKDLHISRVPKHSRRWFIDYANERFEGDYGMCLNEICNTFRGMTPVGYYEMQSEIDELRNEVSTIKDMLIEKENKPKVKTMADGTEMKR